MRRISRVMGMLVAIAAVVAMCTDVVVRAGQTTRLNVARAAALR